MYFSIKIGIEDTSNIVDKITDEKVEVKDLLSVIKSFEKSLQEKDKPGEFPTSEMDGEYLVTYQVFL